MLNGMIFNHQSVSLFISICRPVICTSNHCNQYFDTLEQNRSQILPSSLSCKLKILLHKDLRLTFLVAISKPFFFDMCINVILKVGKNHAFFVKNLPNIDMFYFSVTLNEWITDEIEE